MKKLIALWDSLTLRWQLQPELTIGLPLVSLVVLGGLLVVQMLPIAGDGSAWIAVAVGALSLANVFSPLAFHFRRVGNERFSAACSTAMYAAFWAPAILAFVLPR